MQKKDPIVNPDGTVVPDTESEPEYEVPFNMATLRKHLAQVAMARKVLPDDATARQKLLEESVYDVAAERLKHQAKLFEELGINDKGLNNQDLRAWMWTWHVKLQGRLKAEVANVMRAEAKLGEWLLLSMNVSDVLYVHSGYIQQSPPRPIHVAHQAGKAFLDHYSRDHASAE